MKKVFVGLSGGVDSSVAAALLVREGYNVTGVYMKNWSRDIAGYYCPWKEDLASARLVAAHLKIPFKIFDFEKQYFDLVTKYMVDTYKRGLTPNPDIMCNQEIKFKIFLNKCLVEGADVIATGHYARLKKGQLKTAKDINKDQTYFLYRIDPKIANKILFPIGDYHKAEVRELAKKFGMPTANRPDSQGLCFVGPVPIDEFLAEFVQPKQGNIINEKGNVIGKHNGAFNFTIGQRHGLGIGGGKPYFVYKIDTKANRVYVTTNEKSKLLNKTKFIIKDCVWWQNIEAEDKKQNYKVRVRYRSNTKSCMIKKLSKDNFKIILNSPERAITPGQSAVIYTGNTVVGGGIIVST